MLKLPVPGKQKPGRNFELGQRVRVNLPTDRIEEAVIGAIVERADGLHLRVGFGHEQTALIHVRQVVKD